MSQQSQQDFIDRTEVEIVKTIHYKGKYTPITDFEGEENRSGILFYPVRHLPSNLPVLDGSGSIGYPIHNTRKFGPKYGKPILPSGEKVAFDPTFWKG